jgi:HK97 family phage major capsid protein
MEGAVQDELTKIAGQVIDYNILNGSFSSNKGLKGIAGDTVHSQAYVMSNVGGVTKGNIEAMMALVLPESQDRSMWVVSPGFWKACQLALLNSDNIGGQLIKDGKEKSLYGYPVHVTAGATATAHPAVFGDFSDYVIGIDRDVEITTDTSAGFATDTTIVKVRARLAGGLGVSKRYYGGNTYTSTAYATVSTNLG